MKTFHCDHCGQLLFFKNTDCIQCGHKLAYLPGLVDMVSLEDAGDGRWTSPATGAAGKTYRLCSNYSEHQVCNWAVAEDGPDSFCVSCRLTRTIPDLGVPGNREKWYRLECAKRRLVYSLMQMELPLADKTENPDSGLYFDFLADSTENGGAMVLTGHNEGLITLNIAEADDAEREKRRTALHEPYRTLAGHFRHEVGHYYWDRLVRDDDELLEPFRRIFGDERQDYGEALEKHYREGPPAGWQQNFVTAYACSHPWEDWAETWAHYLHMTDTLETAAANGLWLRPIRKDEPALRPDPGMQNGKAHFDLLIENWFSITYVLNNLNRGLGLQDAYPFVLSSTAIDKLRFVHDCIAGARNSKGKPNRPKAPAKPDASPRKPVAPTDSKAAPPVDAAKAAAK